MEAGRATILVISFLFGLMAVQLIVRNRGYFAETARYINEQRSFFFSSRPMGFKNLTDYYTDYSQPKRLTQAARRFYTFTCLRSSAPFYWVSAAVYIGFILGWRGVFVWF